MAVKSLSDTTGVIITNPFVLVASILVVSPAAAAVSPVFFTKPATFKSYSCVSLGVRKSTKSLSSQINIWG